MPKTFDNRIFHDFRASLPHGCILTINNDLASEKTYLMDGFIPQNIQFQLDIDGIAFKITNLGNLPVFWNKMNSSWQSPIFITSNIIRPSTTQIIVSPIDTDIHFLTFQACNVHKLTDKHHCYPITVRVKVCPDPDAQDRILVHYYI